MYIGNKHKFNSLKVKKNEFLNKLTTFKLIAYNDKISTQHVIKQSNRNIYVFGSPSYLGNL